VPAAASPRPLRPPGRPGPILPALPAPAAAARACRPPGGPRPGRGRRPPGGVVPLPARPRRGRAARRPRPPAHLGRPPAPAVRYCVGFLNKRRFFLVGSDYVFPRAANAVIGDELKALGGQVVGEAYVPLGSGEVTEVVRKIVASKPDVILNTINGDSNRTF